MDRAVRGEHHYPYMKQEKKAIFFMDSPAPLCAPLQLLTTEN